MLRHLGETNAADRLEGAVRAVIAEAQVTTYDLGGSAGTREFAAEVARQVAA
jgi:isocitrate dehydrogenase (NAD+)